MNFPHPIWKYILILMGLVIVWFFGLSIYSLFNYIFLNVKTETLTSTFFVKEVSDEKYLLGSNYTFKANDKIYHGTTLFYYPAYLNEFAANKALKEKSNTMQVWYNKNNPEYSSLQKIFPYKEILSFILLLGVFIYFIILCNYASKLGKHS